MKIKQHSSIDIKYIIALFFGSGIISLVLRCIQTAKYIDPKTGFYTGGEVLTVILYLILAVSFVAFTVVSFLSKETSGFELDGIKSGLLGATVSLFSASLFYDSLHSLFKSFEALSGTSALGGIQSFMASGYIPLTFQSIFAFFSGVYFAVVASDCLKGKSKSRKFKVLALSPVGWAGFRLVYRFISQISFIEVSDLFLELIMLAFMVLFFMALAQINSGVYSDGFSWRISGFGLSAGLIGLILSITRLLFTFIQNGKFISVNHPFSFADFAFSVFVALLVITLKSKIDADKDEFYGEQMN